MTADRIEQMRKMVRDLPEEPRTRYFLAHELFRSKEWQEAAEHYEAYLRLSPGDSRHRFRPDHQRDRAYHSPGPSHE